MGILRAIIRTLVRAIGIRRRSPSAEMIRFRPHALR